MIEAMANVPDYTTRTTCRVCGSGNLVDLFSLGDQYVSDFVDKDRIYSGIKCPIDIILCQNCTLVQQKHTARQDFLYTRHYWYRSGVTEIMRQALREIVCVACALVDPQPGDVVLDIGANDGTLLKQYKDFANGLVTVGVEPATNLADECRKNCDVFVGDFWSEEAYVKNQRISSLGRNEELCMKKAKIITAIGCFYDMEDPGQFVADVAKVLHPEGVFIAQLMCLKQMLDIGDIGNLCHEHLEFYSLKSLLYLYRSHGLKIFKIEENDVNGGSYRIYARLRDGDWSFSKDNNLIDCLEKEVGLSDLDSYVQFRSEMETNRRLCRDFIVSEVEKGKKVWVFGSSTKGNVLLQFYCLGDNPVVCPKCKSFDINVSVALPLDARKCAKCHHVFWVWDGPRITLMGAAADKSPEKLGEYTIGTGIPIKSEQEFRDANPDYALVLPYAFLSEFVEREKEWLEGGGKFIVPLPKPYLVEMDGQGLVRYYNIGE